MPLSHALRIMVLKKWRRLQDRMGRSAQVDGPLGYLTAAPFMNSGEKDVFWRRREDPVLPAELDALKDLREAQCRENLGERELGFLQELLFYEGNLLTESSRRVSRMALVSEPVMKDRNPPSMPECHRLPISRSKNELPQHYVPFVPLTDASSKTARLVRVSRHECVVRQQSRIPASQIARRPEHQT
jgi:hypothetical protein